MTDQEKQAHLEGFQKIYDLIEAKADTAGWEKTRDMFMHKADEEDGMMRVPMLKAAADIQEIISKPLRTMYQLKVAIAYIQATPAAEITMESIKAKMEE